MSTWIYLQAFLDVALGLGFLLLLGDRLRRRSAERWQREVAALVDTLGELVVEVDRLTSGPAARAADAEAGPLQDREPAPGAVAPDSLAARVFAPSGPPFVVPAVPEDEVAPGSPEKAAAVDRMLAFARDGLDTEEIARRVGRPVGEVALVLGLRGPQAAGARG